MIEKIGAPKGSMLGSLLFDIDICDLLFVDINSDILDYAGSTTLYECNQHCGNLISNLELTVDKVLSWCDYNCLLFMYSRKRSPRDCII